jgi:hypothetical protein
VQQPDSLCAKVLKSRYFPDGNILNVVPTDGMSYPWRSIIHGVALVKEGYIWRIGNGETVKIWDDHFDDKGLFSVKQAYKLKT